MKTTRRAFIKITALSGAALALPRFAQAFANSSQLQKWMQPIRGLGPGGIPVVSGIADPVFANTTLNQITIGEFPDQLHPQLGPTRLLGYRDTLAPVPRHLGGVIIATRGTANRIRFTNTLPATHILPVDTTILAQIRHRIGPPPIFTAGSYPGSAMAVRSVGLRRMERPE